MPQCTGITLRRRRCRHDAAPGRQRCGMHAVPEELIEDADNAAIVWDIIEPYVATDLDRVRIVMNHFRGNHVLTHFWADILWRRALIRHQAELEAIEDPFDRVRVGIRGLIAQIDYVREQIVGRNLLGDFNQAAGNTLQDIAADSQGVHRRAVSRQTNVITDYLLKTEVPKEQNTLNEIRDVLGRSGRKVLVDMKLWYEKATCRNEGDRFYQRLLDCVWARIIASEHRLELTKRLQEEASESIGMCCEGHIVRLCNVFAGFLDECVMELPLQDVIAEISKKDISMEEKVLEAWKLMDERNVPEAERTAWIDAL